MHARRRADSWSGVQLFRVDSGGWASLIVAMLNTAQEYVAVDSRLMLATELFLLLHTGEFDEEIWFAIHSRPNFGRLTNLTRRVNVNDHIIPPARSNASQTPRDNIGAVTLVGSQQDVLC